MNLVLVLHNSASHMTVMDPTLTVFSDCNRPCHRQWGLCPTYHDKRLPQAPANLTKTDLEGWVTILLAVEYGIYFVSNRTNKEQTEVRAGFSRAPYPTHRIGSRRPLPLFANLAPSVDFASRLLLPVCSCLLCLPSFVHKEPPRHVTRRRFRPCPSSSTYYSLI